MNATITHHDPEVEEMAKEMPIRKDLAKMELDSDPETAKAQLLIRQAVPIPLHEMLANQIQDWLWSLLKKKK